MSLEVHHRDVVMAQKALVLNYMCFVCNHTNRIKTIQNYSQVQTLVGLVEHKIDN